MLVLAFLSSLAICNAASLADVVCNGKDSISFTFTANAGSTINHISTKNCPGTNIILDESTYTKTGDVYNFNFNPYTACVPGADPNSAASYNVDFGLLVTETTELDGKSVIFGGDTLNLKCTFLDTYQVISELGTIALAGEEVDGIEFALAFEMIRTTDDYATETSTEIETNAPVYHVIRSSSQDKLANTDFTFKPYNIRLEKKNSDPPVFFDLFTESMGTCGHSQLGFEMQYDSTNNKWTFKYNQILLDADLSAEYRIVADVELCNSLSTSSKCTAADVCTGPTIAQLADPEAVLPLRFSHPGPVSNAEKPHQFGSVVVYANYDIYFTYHATQFVPAGKYKNLFVIGRSSGYMMWQPKMYHKGEKEIQIHTTCHNFDTGRFVGGIGQHTSPHPIVDSLQLNTDHRFHIKGRVNANGNIDISLYVDGVQIIGNNINGEIITNELVCQHHVGEELPIFTNEDTNPDLYDTVVISDFEYRGL